MLLEGHLASLSATRLKRMRQETAEAISGLQHDLTRIDRAIRSKEAGHAPSSAAAPRPQAPKGATARRVLDALARADGLVTPKEIMLAVNGDGGHPVQANQIYNILSRMVRNGTVIRRESRYGLPSIGNGTAQGLAGGYGRTAAPTPVDGLG